MPENDSSEPTPIDWRLPPAERALAEHYLQLLSDMGMDEIEADRQLDIRNVCLDELVEQVKVEFKQRQEEDRKEELLKEPFDDYIEYDPPSDYAPTPQTSPESEELWMRYSTNTKRQNRY